MSGVIEFKKCAIIDGVPYLSLEKAKAAQVKAILIETMKSLGQTEIEGCAAAIVSNAERILDVLTTTDSSRPKARAVNGGRKPRKKNIAPVTPEFISQ